MSGRLQAKAVAILRAEAALATDVDRWSPKAIARKTAELARRGYLQRRAGGPLTEKGWRAIGIEPPEHASP